jgi:hypothetical protein
MHLISFIVTLSKRIVVTDTYSALLPNLQLSVSVEAFRIMSLALQYGEERRVWISDNSALIRELSKDAVRSQCDFYYQRNC